jgi:hypothetical protein
MTLPVWNGLSHIGEGKPQAILVGRFIWDLYR